MKPRVNQWPQPTPQEKEKGRETAQRYRRAHLEREAARRPWKEKFLRAGPELRSVEAALDCMCGCHPSINLDTHDGGSSCTCQDTTPELKAARKEEARKALAALQGVWDDEEHLQRQGEEKAAVEAAAAAQGVDLRTWGGLAPFQMTGVVDGLSFYVRERHQSFRVHVAPPASPMHFVQGEGRLGRGDIIIEEGADEILYDGDSDFYPANAVVFTACAVRDYQRRAGCSHILTNEGGTIQFRFCPVCGVRTEEITGFVQ